MQIRMKLLGEAQADKNITKCPNCGGPVMRYHTSGITRVVCRGKCQGWKVLQEIDRTKPIKDEEI